MGLTFDQKLGVAGLGLAVLTFIAGTGVALGMDARTKGEFVFVIVCFVVCAIALSFTFGAWLWISEMRPWLRIIASVLVIGIIWTCFFSTISWVSGRRSTALAEAQYKVDVPLVLMGAGQFWALYRSGFGETVSPVDCVLVFSIVNNQSKRTTFSSLSVDVRTKDGWMDVT